MSRTIYTIDELKQKIAPVAEKYSVPAVYIFGSYARGEATDESDVDVLIQREGSIIRGWLMGGFYEELQESLGKELDLVTVEALEQETTMEQSPWFAKNIRTDIVKIYG